MAAEERSRRRSVDGTAESRLEDATSAEEAPRILVVDDDEVLLGVYALLLEAEGFAVATSAGAQQGFEMLVEAKQLRRPFALLITDFVMPDNRGNVLISAVRDLERDDLVPVEDRLPILLLTGVALSTLSKREQDDLMIPGVSYLSKNDAHDRLISTVNRILRRARP